MRACAVAPPFSVMVQRSNINQGVLPWTRHLTLFRAHHPHQPMIANSTEPINYQNMETKLTEFQAHSDCVSSCHFCYNDSVIVTASHDATIALWVSGLAQYGALIK